MPATSPESNSSRTAPMPHALTGPRATWVPVKLVGTRPKLIPALKDPVLALKNGTAEEISEQVPNVGAATDVA